MKASSWAPPRVRKLRSHLIVSTLLNFVTDVSHKPQRKENRMIEWFHSFSHLGSGKLQLRLFFFFNCDILGGTDTTLQTKTQRLKM